MLSLIGKSYNIKFLLSDICRQNHLRGDLHSSCAFDVMFGSASIHHSLPSSSIFSKRLPSSSSSSAQRNPISMDNIIVSTRLITEEWNDIVQTLRYFDSLKSTKNRAAITSVRRFSDLQRVCVKFTVTNSSYYITVILFLLSKFFV